MYWNNPFFWIGFVIILVLVGLGLAYAIYQRRKRLENRFTVAIENGGNVVSRYLLRLENGPERSLVYTFADKGKRLPVERIAGLPGSSQSAAPGTGNVAGAAGQVQSASYTVSQYGPSAVSNPIVEVNSTINEGQRELGTIQYYLSKLGITGGSPKTAEARAASTPQGDDWALTGEIRAFRDARDWLQFHNPKELAVAIAAAGRLRRARRWSHLLRLGEIPARQNIGAAGRFRPRRVAVAPHLVLPIGNPAIAAERGLGVHHHGGTIGLPAELVIAHPLQADRPVGHRPSQQCRIGRNVVRTVVAVAARTLHVDATDRRGRHFQNLDQFRAQRKHALRMRPHRHTAIPELGNGAGWTDRTMRHVWLGVDRFECARIGGRRGLLDADGRVLAGQRFDHFENTRGVGQFGS